MATINKLQFSTSPLAGATKQESTAESFAKLLMTGATAVGAIAETKYKYDQRIKADNEAQDAIFSLDERNKFEKFKTEKNFPMLSGQEQFNLVNDFQKENDGQYAYTTEKYKLAMSTLYENEKQTSQVKIKTDTENMIKYDFIPKITNDIGLKNLNYTDIVNISKEWESIVPNAKEHIISGLKDTMMLDLGKKEQSLINGGYKTTEQILSGYSLFNGGKDSIQDPKYTALVQTEAGKISAASKTAEIKQLTSMLGMVTDPTQANKINQRLLSLGENQISIIETTNKNAGVMAEEYAKDFSLTGNTDSLNKAVQYGNVSGKENKIFSDMVTNLEGQLLAYGQTGKGASELRKSLIAINTMNQYGVNKNFIKPDTYVDLMAFIQYNGITDITKASDAQLSQFLGMYTNAKKNNYKPISATEFDSLAALKGLDPEANNYYQVRDLTIKNSRLYGADAAYSMAITASGMNPYLKPEGKNITTGVDMSGTGIRDNEQFKRYIERIEKERKVKVQGISRIDNRLHLDFGDEGGSITITDKQIQKWVSDQSKIDLANKQIESEKSWIEQNFPNYQTSSMAKRDMSKYNNIFDAPSIQRIKNNEGFKDTMYKDANGMAIGYGTHLNPNTQIGAERLAIVKTYPNGKIPKALAERWFNQDYDLANKSATKYANKYQINNKEFIAGLTEANYQLGNKWLEQKFPTVNKMFITNDPKKYSETIKIIRKSDWYKQTPNRAEQFINTLSKMKD